MSTNDINIFQEYATAEVSGVKLMSEENFNKLMYDGLISPVRLEHLKIKIAFRRLRDLKIRTGDAIEAVRGSFPHLQYDTIRRIVYHHGNGSL